MNDGTSLFSGLSSLASKASNVGQKSWSGLTDIVNSTSIQNFQFLNVKG